VLLLLLLLLLLLKLGPERSRHQWTTAVAHQSFMMVELMNTLALRAIVGTRNPSPLAQIRNTW
jgi:hypothetical protein